VGVATFLRAPLTDLRDEDADVVIFGAPTDEGSPFLPGSRFAPKAIREHSTRFVGNEPGYFDPRAGEMFLVRELRDRRILDASDAAVLPTNVEATFEAITLMTRRILDLGASPVVLGGDHAITYPVVRAFETPIHVVHFDAHLDYEPFTHGLRFTNGHAFRHISAMQHVASLTQVGIRSIRTMREELEGTIADGNRVVTIDGLRAAGAVALMDTIPEGADVYVSIDIDVLDIALVPGCVSAEPDGMTYQELRDALALLARRTRIVGFDLTEVNPLLDVPTGVTSYLAAHLIIEFLARICRHRDQP
jgi:agmatinase